jgi:hypothetical protein
MSWTVVTNYEASGSAGGHMRPFPLQAPLSAVMNVELLSIPAENGPVSVENRPDSAAGFALFVFGCGA